VTINGPDFRDGKATSSRTDRPYTLRTVVISSIALVAAVMAAVPTWVLVSRVAAGVGGPMVPISATALVAGIVFWKAVRTLHNHIR
jgi:hypothetical protein